MLLVLVVVVLLGDVVSVLNLALYSAAAKRIAELEHDFDEAARMWPPFSGGASG